MALLNPRRARAAALVLVAAFALTAWASTTTTTTTKTDLPSLETLSLAELDAQLQPTNQLLICRQECPIITTLSSHKAAHHARTPSSLTTRLFATLFPSSHPAINALLATLYISGPPNFLLALCPTNIDPASLSVMVAFAVGGLLGDTLFHLLPEIFLGEDEPDRVRMVLVEPNRNLLLGVAVLVGFLVFVGMDKGLRIATGGSGGHSHGHDHGHGSHAVGEGEGRSSAMEEKGEGARWKKEVNPSVKLGGLLNMIADFTHNITDGLAMSASFYASPTIGATTTVAVFFHEIPHEVGDFALLVQSGFSKRQAMGAQFVTAIGALLGTLIGIAVQEFGGGGGGNTDGPEMGMRDGLWGTSLTWGDMLLPFTAGTFLYVGTVAVIPELLETGANKAAELRKTLVQFAAILAGAGIMLYISWHD
ncbi:ZIP zinc transporter-domain-containing protein [Parachaetomium inaequale]|uniref:ZIP zinc transporter-domain-containing protein n=1 Tax=Parachaetomium inaequale TaxID=2588326 RepID=A0AAN6PCB0_9PEZI|nr:ZIP zinc transporter-domain-containing protein [Parachaetomium inaequale]